jgi:hypothetical protein
MIAPAASAKARATAAAIAAPRLVPHPRAQHQQDDRSRSLRHSSCHCRAKAGAAPSCPAPTRRLFLQPPPQQLSSSNQDGCRALVSSTNNTIATAAFATAASPAALTTHARQQPHPQPRQQSTATSHAGNTSGTAARSLAASPAALCSAAPAAFATAATIVALKLVPHPRAQHQQGDRSCSLRLSSRHRRAKAGAAPSCQAPTRRLLLQPPTQQLSSSHPGWHPRAQHQQGDRSCSLRHSSRHRRTKAGAAPSCPARGCG